MLPVWKEHDDGVKRFALVVARAGTRVFPVAMRANRLKDYRVVTSKDLSILYIRVNCVAALE